MPHGPRRSAPRTRRGRARSCRAPSRPRSSGVGRASRERRSRRTSAGTGAPGSSCGDRSRASGYRSKYSDIRASAGGGPATTARSPGRLDRGVRVRRRSPTTPRHRGARMRCAIGISGLTCPSPEVLVTSTLMVRRRRARSRAAGRGTVPARRDAGSGRRRARPRASIVRCGCATSRDSPDRDRRRATRNTAR